MSQETILQKQILDYLESVGIFAWRNNTQGILKGKGVRCKNPAIGSPDILGILPTGTLLGIEVKAPGKKPSDKQSDWLSRAKANNGTVFWVDNFEDFVNRLSILHLTK